jgi:hypothetical protein
MNNAVLVLLVGVGGFLIGCAYTAIWFKVWDKH